MRPRALVPEIQAGKVRLERESEHHLVRVLRLREGHVVEVFDAQGHTATGQLHTDEQGAYIEVERVEQAARRRKIRIASAIPKGQRADWMVEKLAELGVAEFIPLLTARSVVTAEGKNKLERWQRLASQASEQSRSPGVMAVAAPMPVGDLLATDGGSLWVLATEREGASVARAAAQLKVGQEVTVAVGPEGGWDGRELEAFAAAGCSFVRLGETVLRIETAALTAAAVLACLEG